jgi:hypothetical protein
VTFVDNGGGSASLSGTPTDPAAGVFSLKYALTIKATNGTAPNAATTTQPFTLIVWTGTKSEPIILWGPQPFTPPPAHQPAWRKQIIVIRKPGSPITFQVFDDEDTMKEISVDDPSLQAKKPEIEALIKRVNDGNLWGPTHALTPAERAEFKDAFEKALIPN